MSSTKTLHQIHLSNFADYHAGDITFNQCWTKQRNILDRCEQILKEQIKQLQSLNLPQEASNSTIPMNTIEEDDNIENDDTIEEVIKTEDDDKVGNRTWSVGILSNFIRNNDHQQKPRDYGRDENRKTIPKSEKEIKEPFKNLLNNLKMNNSKKPKVEKRTIICQFCGKDFSDKRSPNTFMWLHIERTHMGVKYLCRHCEYENSTKTIIYKHIDVNHVHGKVTDKELAGLRAESILLKCSLCKEKFNQRAEMLTHMEENHYENLVKGFTKYGLRYGEVNRLHQPVTVRKKDSESGRVSYSCPQCSFKSLVFWNLKVHLGTHIGSVFQCTLCEEEHRRKFNVMEHIRLVHSDKRDPTNRKWVDNHIVCHCESCDTTGTVKEYDQHLHDQHDLPLPSNKQSVM